MLWIDKDFDYNDQLARVYMKYKGKYYDKGTIVKIRGILGVVTAEFTGWTYGNHGCFRPINENESSLYNNYNPGGVNAYIVEIVKPVCPKLDSVTPTQTENRSKPPSWDVEVAWIWYIVIMLVTVIFKDRIGLWILESFIFFGWKEGIFKGGKKK